MSDFPELKSKINIVKYNSKSLMKLFEEYNEKVAPNKFSYINKTKNKIIISPIINTGLSITSVNFTSTHVSYQNLMGHLLKASLFVFKESCCFWLAEGIK